MKVGNNVGKSFVNMEDAFLSRPQQSVQLADDLRGGRGSGN